MNGQRFVTLLLILTLLLVSGYVSAIYLEGTWDFESMATTTTEMANHFVVGEVTNVSFVFQHLQGETTSGPISMVTLRVDRDMLSEIERANTPVNERPERNSDTQYLEFVQNGGPYPDGDYVEVVGIRRLKVGDYLFLRLIPIGYEVTYNGKTLTSCTVEFGTTYDVTKKASIDVSQYVIKKAWKGLDMSVGDMNRIVRATLRKTERMRTMERNIGGRANTNGARHRLLMQEVTAIETELNLPALPTE